MAVTVREKAINRNTTTEGFLLVDDERFFRERLARAFEARGFQVWMAAGYTDALEIIEKHRPAMGVFGLKLRDRNGLELIDSARKNHPEMKIVMLTGYGSIATAIKAIKLGAINYLSKPADVDDIINVFSRDGERVFEGWSPDFKSPSLARMEWEHINRVLFDCHGNISLAARKLGIHRRTLQRKLYKYAPNN